MAAVSAVDSSRFKTLLVKTKSPSTKGISIKSFVEENKLSFKKGRGFYQLTKPEVIQDYKEIIVRKKSNGSYVTGDSVREVLEIPKTSKKFKLDLEKIPDFDVFVQSTSVNRVLLPETEFLYELEDEEKPSTVADVPKGGRGRSTRSSKRKAAEVEKDAGDDKPTPTKRPKKEDTSVATVKTRTTRSRAPRGGSKGGASSAARGKAKAKPKAPTKRSGATVTETSEDKDEPDNKKEEEEAMEAEMPAPPTGSGGPVEIVFSFDTTGSMYPCLTQVRRNISDTVKRLQKEIPGIRIAIIAHGDYCDSHTYVTKIQQFTNDVAEVIKFVESVQATGGGDWEECYELVLHEARTKLSWTPGTQRSLVMIGDAIPHDTMYPMNTNKLDWKTEAKKLYDELGVRIYSVQALNNSASTSFYSTIAKLTSGYHLHLDQFSTILQFILAICFREKSLDQLQAFENEVRSKGLGINRSLHKLFDTLAGRGTTAYSGGEGSGDLTPVDPARFQVLDVDERCDIRTFVQKNSLIFKAGQGFYEFTKPEKISDKKEVVLVDKITGDMFTGPEACQLIGAGGSGKIKPASLEKWRVFVQSTSYNRVLMPNTGFLYEVDPEH